MNSKKEFDDLVKHTQERSTASAVEELLRSAETLNQYVLREDAKAMPDEQRYKVVFVGGWNPWRRYAVLAGSGTMHYFRGTKKQCSEVARRCLTSYRDGAYIAWQEERERVDNLVGDALRTYQAEELVGNENPAQAKHIVDVLLDDFDNYSYFSRYS